MKCQRCKEREANVQIMQQISGKKPQTFMLCDVCARELGISMPTFPMPGKASSNPFSVLGSIFQSNLGLGADEIEEKPVSRCKKCSMSFEEFKKSGLLGCPDCYETFAAQMDPVFSRTQMGQKHAGRKPGVKSIKGEEDQISPEDSGEAGVIQGVEESGAKPAKNARKKNASDTAGGKQNGKRKLSADKDESDSEELIALERQHMDRLIEEKKKELAEAVSAENYLKAAKVRDEIAELTKKRGVSER